MSLTSCCRPIQRPAPPALPFAARRSHPRRSNDLARNTHLPADSGTSIRRVGIVAMSLPRSLSNRKKATRPEFDKPTLFDVPVSNNGARVRMLIYLKGLEDEIDIVSPGTLGGLKSAEYCALNPQGKMPLLVLPDGTAFPESEVILQYLADKYEEVEPSLIPHTPELRAKGALATRFHDMYITTIQAAMYRAMDIGTRAEMIAAISEQLDVLEENVMGPYLVGHSISLADCALFPTFIFMNHILVKHFGWENLWHRRPKLHTWWETMGHNEVAIRVKAEVEGGLKAWDEKGRYKELGILEQIENKDYKWSY